MEAIFNLYNKKKTITVEDDEGKKVSILLAKLTDGENAKVREYYENKLLECIKELEKTRTPTLMGQFKSLPKKAIISALVDTEEPLLALCDDLAVRVDSKDEEGNQKPPEQIEKERKEAVKEWRKRREEELGKEPISALRREYVSALIRSIAEANAIQHWQLAALTYICRCPDRPEKRMFSLNEKSENYIRNLAPETLGKLEEELNAFTGLKSDRDIREASQSPDFTGTTGSGKTLDGSPPSTESP